MSGLTRKKRLKILVEALALVSLGWQLDINIIGLILAGQVGTNKKTDWQLIFFQHWISYVCLFQIELFFNRNLCFPFLQGCIPWANLTLHDWGMECSIYYCTSLVVFKYISCKVWSTNLLVLFVLLPCIIKMKTMCKSVNLSSEKRGPSVSKLWVFYWCLLSDRCTRRELTSKVCGTSSTLTKNLNILCCNIPREIGCFRHPIIWLITISVPNLILP